MEYLCMLITVVPRDSENKPTAARNFLVHSFGEGDARTYPVRCQVMLPGVSGLVPLDGPCLKFNGF